MRELKDCRLYGIVDLNYVRLKEVISVTRQMAEAGVDILQLRSKSKLGIAELVNLAHEMQSITESAGVPLIINDYPQVVQQSRANGLHIGQDDGSMAEARKTIPDRSVIVGRSTHSLTQAIAAQKEGADYIGFGPLFATPTKPDYTPIGIKEIADVHAAVTDIPIFCIGGIKLENLEAVIDAGAQRVVIVSGILQAENIVRYVESVKAKLQ